MNGILEGKFIVNSTITEDKLSNELIEKINDDTPTIEIVQKTGSNPDTVMSQKAVTEALNTKADSSELENYLPLSGGTLKGLLRLPEIGLYLGSGTGNRLFNNGSGIRMSSNTTSGIIISTSNATGNIALDTTVGGGMATYNNNEIATKNDIPTDYTKTSDLENYVQTSILIPENADLNDYTNTGFYRCALDVTAATIQNKPTSEHAFSLLVEKTTGSGSTQTFTYYSNTEVNKYVRNLYSGTWSEWKRITLDSDLNSALTNYVPTTRKVNGKALNADITLTASDVGAAKLSDIPTDYAKTSDLENYIQTSISIPENADLNDYIETGFYYCGLDVTASSILNTPAKYAFSLFVERTTTILGVTQTFTDYGINPSVNRYIRNCYNGTWSEWKRITLDSDLAKYLPLTGGTLTGNTTITGNNNIYFNNSENAISYHDTSGLRVASKDVKGITISTENGRGDIKLITNPNGIALYNGDEIATKNDIPTDYAKTSDLENYIQSSISIPENADLNDYRETGFYKCPASTTAETILNSPTKFAFSLLVEESAGNNGCIQTLTGYSSGTKFTREIYFDGNSNLIITKWKQLVTNDQLDNYVPTTRKINGKALDSDITLTATDVGATTSSDLAKYLPLTGGTLTGNLTINNPSTPALDIGESGTTNAVRLNLRRANGPNYISANEENGHFLFTVNGTEQTGTCYTLNATGFIPSSNATNVSTIGTSANRWNAVYGNTLYEGTTPLSNKYLPLTGGTLTGNLTMNQNTINLGSSVGHQFLQGTTDGTILRSNTQITLNATNSADINLTTVGNGIATYNGEEIATKKDIPTDYVKSSSLNNYVPITRKVNGKTLNADINLTASDIGAASASDISDKLDITELFPQGLSSSNTSPIVAGYNNTYGLATSGNVVFGNSNTLSNTTYSLKNVVIGVSNTLSTNAIENIAIGNGITMNTSTSGGGNIAIGRNVTVGSSSISGATAIGALAKATQNANVAVGYSAEATGSASVAVGSAKATSTNSIAIGNTSSLAYEVRVGTSSTAGATYATSIGHLSYANIEYGVALGYNSIVRSQDHVSTDGIWGPASIGNSGNGMTRRLIGVDNGVNDNDAVNVSQIRNTVKTLNSIWTPVISSYSTVYTFTDVNVAGTALRLLISNSSGNYNYNVGLMHATIPAYNLCQYYVNGGHSNTSFVNSVGTVTLASGTSSTSLGPGLTANQSKYELIINFYNSSVGQSGGYIYRTSILTPSTVSSTTTNALIIVERLQ